MNDQTVVVSSRHGIEAVRWLSILGRVRLESKGLKFKRVRGMSTKQYAAQQLGIPGRPKYEKVIEAIKAKLVKEFDYKDMGPLPGESERLVAK